jgi:hypothetical protein
MSEYELNSLIFELFRDMDSMMEFWITATFAVVVAVFVGRGNLSPRMLIVIASVYLVASLQWGLRWAVLLRRSLHYREELMRLGHPDIPTDPVLIGTVTALIAIMVLVGISAVIIFVRQSLVEAKSATQGEQ